MKKNFKLTVEEVLSRKHFQNAKVVAGKKGLRGYVSWVHIMEVTEIGHLLNGNELVLSTGVGWREKQSSLSFLKQLIDRNAAGLCVEVGLYISEFPVHMIELADKHNFPLIVFEKPVRYIDITQDINTLFMETQYKMLLNLESVSNQLNHLLLSTDGFKRILRLLHQYLNVQVAYNPVEGDLEFYPPINKAKEQRLLHLVHSAEPYSVINSASRSASKPIKALGHKFADLIIISEQDLTEFDSLVLDRAATALSQDQLRLLYVEEKRKYQENHWVLKWMNGEHSLQDIEDHLLAVDPNLKPNGCTVCICEINFEQEEPDLTYYSMIFRTIFEQHGYFSLVSYDRNHLMFSLVNKRKKEDWKRRLIQALDQIGQTDLLKKQAASKTSFGIGKLFSLDKLHVSFDMAKETLQVQKKTKAFKKYFYDDLYVYRLISHLNRQNHLQEYVEDYLGPIIEFDQRKNSQMLETLKVFLEVSGSKKDAADRLYIVRQTLYHRIEKLKELLGDDFMESEKRIAIELAVYAYTYLYGQKEEVIQIP
ncbi:PucR family transcriptional regulator ligand-binding domain-containing protein [Radiobacillus kanasensis]|uniref:PucR family transcriptional regulator n=1 Tax=Radiobacillus kanasensis TaxID=2844358 RepID=UPI001E3E78BF|nr:PucR family transcriptional regulator [Radiobacillus kanasensis]UFT99098.1 PucR family transcriptional regulator ligand-binding domain-containing protein [Radiobacillus kanasensis]